MRTSVKGFLVFFIDSRELHIFANLICELDIGVLTDHLQGAASFTNVVTRRSFTIGLMNLSNGVSRQRQHLWFLGPPVPASETIQVNDRLRHRKCYSTKVQSKRTNAYRVYH